MGYAKEASSHCEREIAILNSVSQASQSSKRKQKLQKTLNEKKEMLAISYFDMARQQEKLKELD